MAAHLNGRSRPGKERRIPAPRFFRRALFGYNARGRDWRRFARPEDGLKFLRMVPLLLTVIRIGLAPAFLMLDRSRAGAEWLLLIVWAAMASDWLDGLLARRWNAVSTAGKLLDPLADALFCMCVFLVFAGPHTSRGGGFIFYMPVWGLGILIAREALVTFIIRPVAWAYGVVVAASWVGKAKTALQFVLMSLVVVPWVAQHEHWVWYGLAMVAFYAVLVFSLASALRYTVTVARVVAGTRGARREDSVDAEARSKD